MATTYNILILGASYGSLLATKLLLAGHKAKLVCLPAEVELINAEGAIVRMPVRGREGLVEVNSRNLPGSLSAEGPNTIDPSQYDLVALANDVAAAGRAASVPVTDPNVALIDPAGEPAGA